MKKIMRKTYEEGFAEGFLYSLAICVVMVIGCAITACITTE